MNTKTFGDFLKAKKKIIMIVGALILLFLLIIVFSAVHKQMEKKRLAEIRNAQIEELIENFKREITPDISYEMSYRTFEYSDTVVCYYIDVDEKVEENLKKTFLEVIYDYGWGALTEPLVHYGVSEDISIRVNNEEIISITDRGYGNSWADNINWDWLENKSWTKTN